MSIFNKIYNKKVKLYYKIVIRAVIYKAYGGQALSFLLRKKPGAHRFFE